MFNINAKAFVRTHLNGRGEFKLVDIAEELY